MQANKRKKNKTSIHWKLNLKKKIGYLDKINEENTQLTNLGTAHKKFDFMSKKVLESSTLTEPKTELIESMKIDLEKTWNWN